VSRMKDELVKLQYRGEQLEVYISDEPPYEIEKYEHELDCRFIISMSPAPLGAGPILIYECQMMMPRPGSKVCHFSSISIRGLCEFVEHHFIKGPEYIECEEPPSQENNWWAQGPEEALSYQPFSQEYRWKFGPDGRRLKYWEARFGTTKAR
jgi:hypothetical protein